MPAAIIPPTPDTTPSPYRPGDQAQMLYMSDRETVLADAVVRAVTAHPDGGWLVTAVLSEPGSAFALTPPATHAARIATDRPARADRHRPRPPQRMTTTTPAPQLVEAGDPLERACEGCTAEPGEPCRPGCLSQPDPITQEDHAMTTTDTTDIDAEDRATAAAEVDQMDPGAAAPVETPPVLAHLDPRALLVDLNIREAKLDKPFVASVKRHGVLVPIVAVTTAGGVRVRMGHRRTLAAVEAGLTTVPVYLSGAEDDDTATRIVAQWSENEHRSALSNPERVEAINQLSLYGLSAAQIATRTATAKRDVSAALTVAGNELAAKAVVRYDFLTLDQAAALTRYEHDTDTVTALVAAAQQGPVQFQRVLAKADDDAAQRAADAERRAPVLALLAAQGCPLIADPDWSVRANDVERWSADGGEAFTPATHAGCPGHAAYLTEVNDRDPGVTDDEVEQHYQAQRDRDPDYDEDDDDFGYIVGPQPFYVCTDPTGHGHRRPGAGPAHNAGVGDDIPGRGEDDDSAAQRVTAAQARAEQAKAEQSAHRREVVANNRSWRQAEPIRRDWLRALLARRTAPKGTSAFLAVTLAEGIDNPTGGLDSYLAATDLLGLPGGVDLAQHVTAQTEARAVVIAAAVAASRYENGLSQDSWRAGTWRSRSRSAARYFTWLAANGYPLCEVERLAGGLPATDPAALINVLADTDTDTTDAESVGRGGVEQDGMVA